ncbi:DUF4277 domain-containing protein [Oculatella sp. LEGE 06141]|uniref:DUF4277 domain-containing protein n=1 Tax=Oculatella sp. LEGE 06141 TaxID=1828648 RepID=UPI001881372A|nr:DUF4277 domain-containing protein [Oculatella sp. LEGE 06141]MBE9181481.1 DUF4277 domain-containing protein [Oculatella sp. LEGE 06141]
MIVQNPDHLGIVAGLVDELEIVEPVNQHLGEDAREQISPGVAVKAVILQWTRTGFCPVVPVGTVFRGEGDGTIY